MFFLLCLGEGDFASHEETDRCLLLAAESNPSHGREGEVKPLTDVVWRKQVKSHHGRHEENEMRGRETTDRSSFVHQMREAGKDPMDDQTIIKDEHQ